MIDGTYEIPKCAKGRYAESLASMLYLTVANVIGGDEHNWW